MDDTDLIIVCRYRKKNCQFSGWEGASNSRCTTITSVTACNHLKCVLAGGKGVEESQLKGEMLKLRSRIISDNIR